MTVGAHLEVLAATPPALRTMPSAASRMRPCHGLGREGRKGPGPGLIDVASGSQGREPMHFGGRRRGQKMAPWMGQAGHSRRWLSWLKRFQKLCWSEAFGAAPAEEKPELSGLDRLVL